MGEVAWDDSAPNARGRAEFVQFIRNRRLRKALCRFRCFCAALGVARRRGLVTPCFARSLALHADCGPSIGEKCQKSETPQSRNRGGRCCSHDGAFSAPKGRNSIAQGKRSAALGCVVAKYVVALKGRNSAGGTQPCTAFAPSTHPNQPRNAERRSRTPLGCQISNHR